MGHARWSRGVVVTALPCLRHALQFVLRRVVPVSDGENMNSWGFACHGAEIRKRLKLVGVGWAAPSGGKDHYGIDPGRILANLQFGDRLRDRAVKSGPIRGPMAGRDGRLQVGPMRSQR